MPDAIEIRACRPEDCSEIAALGKSIWGDWSNGPTLSRQFIDMGHPIFVACHISGELAGYCVGLSEADGVTGYVLSLTIHSNYRRKGLGEKLLKAVVEKLRSQKRRAINTAISDDNDSSKRLFMKHGFCEARKMKDYYEPGDLYCIFNLKL